MSDSSDKEVKRYKNQAKKAAKGLLYSKSVINKIDEATSIGQIQIIMTTARKRKFNKDE